MLIHNPRMPDSLEPKFIDIWCTSLFPATIFSLLADSDLFLSIANNLVTYHFFSFYGCSAFRFASKFLGKKDVAVHALCGIIAAAVIFLLSFFVFLYFLGWVDYLSYGATSANSRSSYIFAEFFCKHHKHA